MKPDTTKNAFIELGKIIERFLENSKGKLHLAEHDILTHAIEKARIENPWFTKENIQLALKGIAHLLEKEKIEQWLDQYSEFNQQIKEPYKVGVVNAGNIPAVGFHDFMSTLMAGHRYLGKLSEKDRTLLPALRDILVRIEPGLDSFIRFEENQLNGFDAIIATGSDNTARYFEYYFAKYPHIIRKNRNSVAVLTGKETDQELQSLADDLFLYFGMGCRNVSKIYFPETFGIKRLFENLEHYKTRLIQHNKYANNYEYHRSIFLMNQTPHLDNGFVLLKEDTGISSPISTVFYEPYKNLQQVKNTLEIQQDQIQCIVSHPETFREAVPFGKSQFPEIWDYADNVDTLRFLLSLDKHKKA